MTINNKPSVFDTCIIIDYAKGIRAAHDLIHTCPKRYISAITWLEFLVGIPEERRDPAKTFLEDNFEIIPIDHDVLKESLLIRSKTKLKIPDALIYSCAKIKNAILVTRNIKDFNPAWLDIHVPYKI